MNLHDDVYIEPFNMLKTRDVPIRISCCQSDSESFEFDIDIESRFDTFVQHF